MAGMADWGAIREHNREMADRVNKHLLIDFNQQILIIFLPLSEGAIQKATETQVGRSNQRC
jgi:hypothetical protein